jgi:hypothetical protein
MPSVITTNGMNYMLQKSFGSTTETVPDEWEVGVDNTTPSISDSTCLGRVPHTYTEVDTCDAITGWAQGGDGTAPILNTTGQNLGTGCIDLRTSFSAGNAYWTKTVTSFNLTTSNRDFYLFFYVDNLAKLSNVSNAVRIYLGTGGMANYNYYDFARSTLIAGEWQVLRIAAPSSPTGTGGGGATLTNIDTIRIEIRNAQSWSSDECRMDAWHYANESDHQKAVELGYPVINAVYQTITWRVEYASNQANGYKLQRVFFKNSNLMSYNSGTYNPVNKNNSKELSITIIMRLQNK